MLNIGSDAKETGSARWPNGVVPFKIASRKNNYDDLPYTYEESLTDTQESIIRRAVVRFNLALRNFDNRDDKNASFIIKYEELSEDQEAEDYVLFVLSSTTNLSFLGRMGGLQKVQLFNCNLEADIPTINHEMLHCAGLGHDHQRTDRDSFINLTSKPQDKRTGIIPEAIVKDQYDILEKTVNIGTYNTQSIMHYNNEEAIYFSNKQNVLNLTEEEQIAINWTIKDSYDPNGAEEMIGHIYLPPKYNIDGRARSRSQYVGI